LEGLAKLTQVSNDRREQKVAGQGSLKVLDQNKEVLSTDWFLFQLHEKGEKRAAINACLRPCLRLRQGSGN
jgi:hypothetical protein